MPMDSKENKELKKDYKNKRFKNRSFIRSLGFASEGIVFTFKHERNFRFQTASLFLVVCLALWLKIKHLEFIILLFCCLMVMACEMINTCFEWMVDLTTNYQYHPIAKHIKDVAAGLVLLTSIFSVVIGIIIFTPYLLALLF
ncbi:diacylglycerol kinase family protein [Aerococcus urinae]